MTALSRAVVDADAVQIVRHLLERRILCLQGVLLGVDLLLEVRDLLTDFALVVVEH